MLRPHVDYATTRINIGHSEFGSEFAVGAVGSVLEPADLTLNSDEKHQSFKRSSVRGKCGILLKMVFGRLLRLHMV